MITRRLALGGLFGPLVFIAAWVIGGLITDGYHPTTDAISKLAANGVATAPLMNVGLVGYGLGLVSFAFALRRLTEGWAWVAALVNGLATWAVALLPLDVSERVDFLHVIAAGVAYVAIAAVPILGIRALRLRSGFAYASAFIGALSGAALAYSAGDWLPGLWQRVGLTVADVWLAVIGTLLWRGSLPIDRARRSSQP